MTTTTAYKAQKIGNQVIEDVNILISGEYPNFGDLETSSMCFKKEAQDIETALINSLPGGTYDQLLCAMLMRKASHFVVPFGGEK